ncbi:MAG: hypothetical protein C4317_06365 [Acidimicrobiia bacterium]
MVGIATAGALLLATALVYKGRLDFTRSPAGAPSGGCGALPSNPSSLPTDQVAARSASTENNRR